MKIIIEITEREDGYFETETSSSNSPTESEKILNVGAILIAKIKRLIHEYGEEMEEAKEIYEELERLKELETESERN